MLIKTNEEGAVQNNIKKRQTITFNSIYFNYDYDLQQFKIIKN